MFKKDKKGSDAPVTDSYSQGGDSSMPPTPTAGGMGGSSASLPPTSRGRRGGPPKGQGGFSEVDLWRPQSTEERQQCVDAFDHKVKLHLISVMCSSCGATHLFASTELFTWVLCKRLRHCGSTSDWQLCCYLTRAACGLSNGFDSSSMHHIHSFNIVPLPGSPLYILNDLHDTDTTHAVTR